jgi:hypothetical protein
VVVGLRVCSANLPQHSLNSSDQLDGAAVYKQKLTDGAAAVKVCACVGGVLRVISASSCIAASPHEGCLLTLHSLNIR